MTRYLFFAALLPVGGLGWVFWLRIERWLSPTQPVEGDEQEGHGDRPDSGADPEFVGEMHELAKEMREERVRLRDLRPIADEYALNLEAPADKAWAEEVLAFRRSGDEIAQHYADDRLGHLEDWLDGWAPGWRRLRLAALIDDTSEFPVVA